MIESLGSKPEISHMRDIDKIIQIMSGAGYCYEMRATHEDKSGEVHFNKPLTNKFYPHVHMIYKPESDQLVFHIDRRQHITKSHSPELSNELENLYKYLSEEFKTQDPHLKQLAYNFSRQTLSYAMFKVSNLLNKNGRTPGESMKVTQDENKRGKLRKEQKHRHLKKKYDQANNFDLDTITKDWELPQEEFQITGNRQVKR